MTVFRFKNKFRNLENQDLEKSKNLKFPNLCLDVVMGPSAAANNNSRYDSSVLCSVRDLMVS